MSERYIYIYWSTTLHYMVLCVEALLFYEGCQFASTSVTAQGKRWIIDGHAISKSPSSRSIRGIDVLQIYQQEQDVSSETSEWQVA